MHPEQKQKIRDALTVLAATHAVVVEQKEHMIDVLTLALETEEFAPLEGRRRGSGAAERPAVHLASAGDWQRRRARVS